MPQMSPMNWLILMLYFMMTYLFSLMLVYFYFLKNFYQNNIINELILGKDLYKLQWY